MLIGLVTFCIAIYWTTRVDVQRKNYFIKSGLPKPNVMEIWTRFPKFILGFIAASLVFSFVLTPTIGNNAVAGILDLTGDFRAWFFCLAFVSIGLESNIRELRAQTAGGKPIQLYLVGQTFNIILTGIAAYLAFGGILFDRIM